MKRSLITIFLLSASILLCSFFVSCHEAIFYYINEEVSLEKNGINGDINSFVLHGDYIYIANGAVFCKTNQPSSKTGKYNKQWTRAYSPDASGYYDQSDTSADIAGYVSSLASDSENMYATVIIWHESTSGYNENYARKIYCASNDGSSLSWAEVDISSIVGSTSDISTSTVKSVFDNQAVTVSYDGTGKASYDLSNRNAYARIYSESDSAYHVYKLNGTSAPTLIADGTNGAEMGYVDSDNPYVSINSFQSGGTCSAVRFNNEDYFSNYYGFATNGTYIYYSTSKTSLNKSAYSTVTISTDLYYADGWDSTNGYTLGGKETKISLDAGGILSISPAGNYLLLGTSSGIKRVALDSATKAPTGRENFSNSTNQNNGDTIISCYVFKTFVLDPCRNEGDPTSSGTDEYAGSTINGSITSAADSFSDTGLYAYYPGRDTWNRDGTPDEASKGN